MIEEPIDNLAESIDALSDLDTGTSSAPEDVFPPVSNRFSDLDRIHPQRTVFDSIFENVSGVFQWFTAGKNRLSISAGFLAMLITAIGFVIFELNKEEWRLQQQYPGAVSSYERQLLRARDFMKAEKYEEAAPIFRELVEKREGNALRADALLLLAECVAKNARDSVSSNEARELYLRFAKEYSTDPRAPSVYRTLAQSFARTELYEESNEQYERLIRAFPDADRNGEIELLIARNYYRAGNLVGAIESLKQVRTKYPDTPVAHDATLLLGHAFGGLGETDDAERILSQMVAEAPGTPHAAAALQILAQNALDAGDNGNAISYCIKWFKESPVAQAQAEVMLTLASAKLSSGMPAETLSVTSDINTFFPDSPKLAEALILRGKAFEATGRIEDAEGAYSEAIGIAPDNPVAHACLGQFYWTQGNLRPAVGEFESACKYDPKNDIFVFNRAKLSALAGEKLKAIELLDEFTRKWQVSAKIGEAGMLLADLQAESGRPDDACRTLSRLLATATTTVEQSVVLEKQGDIYAKSGKYEEAVGVYRMAAEFSSAPDAIRLKAANILLAAGHVQECLDETGSINVSGLAPRDKLNLLTLKGKSYLALKQFDNARRILLEAIALQTKEEKIATLALIMHSNIELKDEKAASGAFSEALRLIENDASEAASEARHIVLQWAQRLYEQGKYSEAAKAYSSIRSPQFPASDVAWAIYQEGNCYFRMEEYGKAKERYVRLASEFSDSEWVRFARQKEEIMKLKKAGT